MLEWIALICAESTCFFRGDVLQVSAPWVYPHPETWVVILDAGIRLVFVPCAGGA